MTTLAALALGACAVPGTSPGVPGPAGVPTAVATALQSCPTVPAGANPAIVDYVDFVRAGGTEFLAGMGQQLTARPDEVGPEQLRVTCNLSELNRVSGRQPGPPGDGAAGRLAVGTPVHALKGWSPRCRLTVKRDGTWTVYRATVPGAPTITYAACRRTDVPASTSATP